MPTAKAKPVEFLTTFPKSLAAISAGALAVLALQTEIVTSLDNIIVTEAEAADFAESQRMTNLRDRIEILKLKLFHAPSVAERETLQAELHYLQEQMRMLQCLADPRNEREVCVN